MKKKSFISTNHLLIYDNAEAFGISARKKIRTGYLMASIAAFIPTGGFAFLFILPTGSKKEIQKVGKFTVK